MTHDPRSLNRYFAAIDAHFLFARKRLTAHFRGVIGTAVLVGTMYVFAAYWCVPIWKLAHS